jgi:demethylmenaquinone methyltransferase/2-methoxy-6-polyprenyl-1,4-benzoquinol methylase
MKRYPGVQGLPPEQHIRMVKDIFSTVTGRYDFLTHLLSLYQDVFWRRFAAGKIRRGKTCRLLDVATGTADLAIEEALRHAGCYVVAMDLMGEMIALGAEKLKKRNLAHRVCLLRADALNIPFPSGTFDAASIAFGIRNVPDKVAALKEMGRVVVPGGQVLVLEMTRPGTRLFLRPYVFYLRTVMPLAARISSPNPAAYRYLADSILHFPSPSDFSAMMRKAGLSPVESYSLTLGITHLFVGYKS